MSPHDGDDDGAAECDICEKLFFSSPLAPFLLKCRFCGVIPDSRDRILGHRCSVGGPDSGCNLLEEHYRSAHAVIVQPAIKPDPDSIHNGPSVFYCHLCKMTYSRQPFAERVCEDGKSTDFAVDCGSGSESLVVPQLPVKAEFYFDDPDKYVEGVLTEEDLMLDPARVSNHVCDECGKVLKSAGILAEHKRCVHSSARVECDQCGVSLKNKKILGEHVLRRHGGVGRGDSNRQHSDNFLAADGSLMHSELDVKEEKLAHSNLESVDEDWGGEEDDDTDGNAQVKVNQGDFECPECGVTRTNKKALREHIFRVHEKHNSHRKCPYCDHSGLPFNLVKHIKKIHPEKATDDQVQMSSGSTSRKTSRRKKRNEAEEEETSDGGDHDEDPLDELGEEVTQESMSNSSQILPEIKEGDKVDEHGLGEVTQAEEEQFKCDVCGAIRNSRKGLREHVYRVHEKSSSNRKCPYCDHIGLPFNVVAHIKRKHPDNAKEDNFSIVHNSTVEPDDNEDNSPKKKCGYCDKSFMGRRALLDHVNRNHVMSKCGNCTFSANFIELLAHKQTCRQRSVKSKMHKAVSDSNERDTTEECDDSTVAVKSSGSKRAFAEGPRKCPHCQKSFLQLKSLRSHVSRNHTLRKCKLCVDVKGSYFHLLVHNLRFHPELALASTKCDKCEKVMGDKYCLARHMRDVHADSKVICDTCGVSCKNTKTLSMHVKLVHEKERYMAQCPQCDFKTPNKQAMRSHISVIHEGRRDFVCHLCGKKSSQKGNLAKHIRLIHGPDAKQRSQPKWPKRVRIRKKRAKSTLPSDTMPSVAPVENESVSMSETAQEMVVLV